MLGRREELIGRMEVEQKGNASVKAKGRICRSGIVEG